VIADPSVLDHERLAIGAGAHGVNLHVGSADLVDVLGAEVADVTRPDDGA
jgi:prolyl-tRNA editing enzyme YbaK/EbsC (Cys-tRNA(Pro) deacylase)